MRRDKKCLLCPSSHWCWVSFDFHHDSLIVYKYGLISSVFIPWYGTFPIVSHDSGQFFSNFQGFISSGFVGSREIHSDRELFIRGQRLYKFMHFVLICLINNTYTVLKEMKIYH